MLASVFSLQMLSNSTSQQNSKQLYPESAGIPDTGDWRSRYNPSGSEPIIYEHNVSRPFGVCHGDSGLDGVEPSYNIQWNRKDHAWAWVEPFNGTFCFNGITIEDEPYKKSEIKNNYNLTLRHYEFNRTAGNTVFAYLDTDTARTNNLFDAFINATTIKLKSTFTSEKTLFVTYNKSVSTAEYFKYMENYIFEHNATGMNYLPILDYNNAYLYDLFPSDYNAAGYYGSVGSYIPPKATWNWLRFVSRTVNRYKNYTDTWEIWNEANNAYTPEQWSHFLLNITLGAAKIIRTIDPTAKIYIGGLGGTREIEYLNSIFEILLSNPAHPEYRNYFDGIAFHPYVRIPELLIYEKMNSYFPVLNYYNWTKQYGKEFLITEIGMETNTSSSATLTENVQYEQAMRVVKSMTIAADVGTSIFIWYCYRDDVRWLIDQDYQNGEWFYGIFEYDLTPKLGAYAFNITSYLLSDSIARRGALRFDSDISVFSPYEHIFGYNFRRADGTEIVILWNNYQTELSAQIQVTGGLLEPAYVYSYTSNERQMIKEAGVGVQSVNTEFSYWPTILSFKPGTNTDYITITIQGSTELWFKVIWIPIILGSLALLSLAGVVVKRRRS
jgi:hypothetical protein